MENFLSSPDVVRVKLPRNPVFCVRPAMAARAGEWFCANFPGKTFFAVKANPSPWLLSALMSGGLKKFETASIKEIRLVRSLSPKAEIAFMHPVKAPESIAEAYFEHGVRAFALDSEAELRKILKATENARDLTLCVRLSVPGGAAEIPLSAKFGARGGEAEALLRKTRQVAERLGACFHVGSQTADPQAFPTALQSVQQAVVRAGVILDVLDVGGGFPATYPGMTPPPMGAFVDAIEQYIETTMLVPENCELWCEPGRALSAEAASLIVRVEHRSGTALYINDGVFGALFDAGPLGWRYPVRHLGNPDGTGPMGEFSFFGPTCDDFDIMRGPFLLPETTDVGDYIEIGMLGAYGSTMRSDFNGFATHEDVIVEDMPFQTRFGQDRIAAASRG
ncbi:MAG: type III PLP-dependent enzyme [Rhodospirillaceae bacterium]